MAEFKIEHEFDPKRKRHYMNKFLNVVHCHHYATLFTQLALDAKEIVDGTQILKESSESVFFEVLSDYYKKNSITDVKDRIDIAAQMFSAIGLGKINIVSGAENGGEIEMPFAYVDEGWIKKWGNNKEPVNFIGAGYVAGMFSAVFGKPLKTYKVTETQSRVMGADKSHFKITR